MIKEIVKNLKPSSTLRINELSKDLELQGNLNVEDIRVPDELEILTSGEISVVSCQLPKEEVEEEPEEDIELEEGEEAEAGTDEGDSTSEGGSDEGKSEES